MTGLEPAMIGMSIAGTALQAAGTIAAGNAAKAQGEAARVAAEFKAAQLRQQAGQERAASQRDAFTERKQAELASSRGLAIAAKSGGGVLNPTVVNLLGDIEAEGEYRALMQIYQGEERAVGLEHGADAALYEGEMAYNVGKAQQKNSRFAALGQFASGAASAGYDAYKAGMFKPSTSPAPTSTKTIAGGSGGMSRMYAHYASSPSF